MKSVKKAAENIKRTKSKSDTSNYLFRSRYIAAMDILNATNQAEIAAVSAATDRVLQKMK